ASAPRQLNFITIKMIGSGIDHWWIEIDGSESYGWWPVHQPTTTDEAALNTGLLGVPGELNGVTEHSRASATRDPHHGEAATESFHPYLIEPSGRHRTDDQIREEIRRFARSFRGDYRVIGGHNCHTFIQNLMRSVGLSRSADHMDVPMDAMSSIVEG